MTLRDLNQFDRVPSPTKEARTLPQLASLPAMMQLHPPPSPGTHRTLRRLQSAHSLGAKAAVQPSLISQQRLQQQSLQQQQIQRLQKPPSPPRRNVSFNNNPSPQRGRANSDAPPIPNPHQLNAMTGSRDSRRSALSKRSLAADAMSLERLLRDGPPNGDVEGALESTRLKILDQGIRSDSDGMVGISSTVPAACGMFPWIC
jgi:cell cycle arrest protein BUB2